jgi:hypothetical protein
MGENCIFVEERLKDMRYVFPIRCNNTAKFCSKKFHFLKNEINVHILSYSKKISISFFYTTSIRHLEIFFSTEKQKQLLKLQRLEHLTTSQIWRHENIAPETETKLENAILDIDNNSGILFYGNHKAHNCCRVSNFNVTFFFFL